MLSINQKGQEKYPHLFKPLKIGNLMIPNRIFFPPWVFNWAEKDGSVSDKLHDFYVNLAKNGCGIIYTGGATVSPDSLRVEYCMGMFDKRQISGNRKLCKEIKARGAVPALQLINFGRQSVTTYTGKPVLAPSNIPCPVTARRDPNYRIKEMTPEDIRRVKNDFVRGAVMAAESGYRIIQLHAAHGYLLCSFLSPYTNKRTDEYGGSLANRCRLIIEIIEAIRRELGDEVLIDIRVSVDEFVNGGLIPADYAGIVPLLEKAGVRMLNASGTNSESAARFFFSRPEPEGKYAYLAETLKRHTSLVVGHAAFLASLATGEVLIQQEKLDLAGFGRMQFADQGFVKKTVTGKKIRQCVWCGRCLNDTGNPDVRSVHCTVNKKYKRPKSNQRISA